MCWCTFAAVAAEDQAREEERMREEYAIPGGGHFQEFVQMHIDTFKELGFNEGEARSQVWINVLTR